MKQYIVYNTKTLKIYDTFEFYGKSLVRCLENYRDSFWLNTSHPKTTEILNRIKAVNNLAD